MGSWLTHMWWGGDPDSPHPLSNLTLRDVYAVQRSWAPVYANSVANGTEILRRLYKDYPETKDFFKLVRKVDDENAYADNPQFKAHVINLMGALNSAISSLNQPEVVKALMQKLGESHQKRKIQQKHFMYLKDVLVKMFIEVLKLDDFTLSAWAKAVDFWFACIFEKLDQPPATSTGSR